MRTKKILVFLLVTVLAIGLSACGMANDERPLTRGFGDDNNRILDYDPNNDGTVRNYSMYNRNNGYNPNAYGYNGYNGYTMNRNRNNGNNAFDRNAFDRPNAFGNYNRYDNRNRTDQFRTNANRDADRIAEVADKVKGVEGATVVIAGGNAYVGLNLDENVRAANANRVEREVYRQLTKTANRYNVFITSDDDLFGRLRDVGDGIRNGTPVNDYRNDLRDFDTRFRTYRR